MSLTLHNYYPFLYGSFVIFYKRTPFLNRSCKYIYRNFKMQLFVSTKMFVRFIYWRAYCLKFDTVVLGYSSRAHGSWPPLLSVLRAPLGATGEGGHQVWRTVRGGRLPGPGRRNRQGNNSSLSQGTNLGWVVTLGRRTPVRPGGAGRRPWPFCPVGDAKRERPSLGVKSQNWSGQRLVSFCSCLEGNPFQRWSEHWFDFYCLFEFTQGLVVCLLSYFLLPTRLGPVVSLRGHRWEERTPQGDPGSCTPKRTGRGSDEGGGS